MQNSTAARHKHWLQFYLSELFQRALQMLPHLNKMTRVQCNGILYWWRDSSPETSGFSNILALRTQRQIVINWVHTRFQTKTAEKLYPFGAAHDHMTYIRDPPRTLSQQSLRFHSLSLGTCRSGFRRSIPTKSSIFQRNRRISRIILRDNN